MDVDLYDVIPVQPQEILQELASKRQLLEVIKGQIKEIEDQPVFVELRGNYNMLRVNLIQLESDVKNYFFERLLVAGKDGLHEAVYVKNEDRFEYDTEKAVEWAMQFAPNMLFVDRAAFEKHAKAVSKTLPLDFVKIHQVEKIVIRKDLDQYVNAAESMEVEEITDEKADGEKVQEKLFCFLETLGVERADRVMNGYDTLMYSKIHKIKL